jgi:hypothetical protein
MIESENETFLVLSSALCGVSVDSFVAATPPKFPVPGDLNPHNTPIDRNSEFIRTLREQVGTSAVTSLLERFGHERQTAASDTVAQNLLRDPEQGPICRSIMKMWFLGVWFACDRPYDAHHVISAQAYKDALVWKVMQSHPMGYSEWTFGYWADDPPPLETFLTVIDK